MKIGRLYLCWGRIPSHHHFAKAGETWTAKYAPSQPRPVMWQIVRADGWHRPPPLIWILWIYPSDGTAIHVEFGFSRRR